MKMYLAMDNELLVVQGQNGQWQAESQLAGLQIWCVAVDPFHPARVYCGTFRRGLWRSEDAGRTWRPVGDPSMRGDGGITNPDITAVAVSAIERAGEYGVVYAGTEPSALFRSDDGGDTWRELSGLRELPSAPTWSFPPRPHTHHVRWITPDPVVSGRVFVAIEAGALVQSSDGGEHWKDREQDGPYDTHTLVMHPQAPDRLYSAAGDGFMAQGRGFSESRDGGNSWLHPDEGFQHHYLWSVAVDPADPDTIVVSASASPMSAHNPVNPENFLYRKTSDTVWQAVSEGLPAAKESAVPVLTTHASEPGVFYALTARGLYRSADAGLRWERLSIPWNEHNAYQRPVALVVCD